MREAAWCRGGGDSAMLAWPRGGLNGCAQRDRTSVRAMRTGTARGNNDHAGGGGAYVRARRTVCTCSRWSRAWARKKRGDGEGVHGIRGARALRVHGDEFGQRCA